MLLDGACFALGASQARAAVALCVFECGFWGSAEALGVSERAKRCGIGWNAEWKSFAWQGGKKGFCDTQADRGSERGEGPL